MTTNIKELENTTSTSMQGGFQKVLDELIEKRTSLVKETEELKKERNELNLAANGWSSTRDELNGQTKSLVEEAQKYKELREEYNQGVSENKAKRDELNGKANKIYAEIDRLRDKYNLSKGQSLNELKKEIDRLEFKQQTNVLTIDKERQLVEKISDIKDEFNTRKKELEENEELRGLLEEAQTLRDEASKYHDKVIEYVNLAQDCHDRMVRIFKNVDRIRAEADKAHKKFVTTQGDANRIHKKFIRYQKELKDFEKIISSLKKRGKESREHRERVATRKKAEELYNQFKKGEKLGTEDLLLLQKSGFL